MHYEYLAPVGNITTRFTAWLGVAAASLQPLTVLYCRVPHSRVCHLLGSNTSITALLYSLGPVLSNVPDSLQIHSFLVHSGATKLLYGPVL